MDREDVIDLGVASDETKGPGGQYVDIGLGKATPGISDD